MTKKNQTILMQIALGSYLLLSTIFHIAAAESLDKVVAVVNEEVITESELNREVNRIKQQMLASHAALPPERDLRKQVLQRLINMNLQLQLAKQNDITIDDTDLNDALNRISTSNRVSMTQLREIITSQGMTWEDYKAMIRKEMLISRLQQKAVSKDINVTEEQVEDYLKLTSLNEEEKLTYHLHNIVVPLSENPKADELDRALKKANNILQKVKQGEEFNRLRATESTSEFILEGGDLGERARTELPELFAKQVVHMKPGQVVGPLKAGNGFQLIKLMKISGEKEEHEVVKTHVRHILIKPDASMTMKEASKQAENIYQQIKAGKNFAMMAKRYSLDPVSAAHGGDLGWITPEDLRGLAPELEEIVEKLALNQISKPIQSAIGWHLVEVLGRKKENDLNSFKRQQALQALQQKKFGEAVQSWQQHLQANAYVNVTDKELA